MKDRPEPYFNKYPTKNFKIQFYLNSRKLVSTCGYVSRVIQVWFSDGFFINCETKMLTEKTISAENVNC